MSRAAMRRVRAWLADDGPLALSLADLRAVLALAERAEEWRRLAVITKRGLEIATKRRRVRSHD